MIDRFAAIDPTRQFIIITNSPQLTPSTHPENVPRPQTKSTPAHNNSNCTGCAYACALIEHRAHRRRRLWGAQSTLIQRAVICTHLRTSKASFSCIYLYSRLEYIRHIERRELVWFLPHRLRFIGNVWLPVSPLERVALFIPSVGL